ncbi:MAG: hypothetical protein U1E65_03820 [Myxococcota bacterium]
MKGRDVKGAGAPPGLSPALETSLPPVREAPVTAATLVEQSLEVRAAVGQAFEAFAPKASGEITVPAGAEASHTVLTRPSEPRGPLSTMAELRAAFPMHRAAIDLRPLRRKRPGPVAEQHLTIKDNAGNLLLVEILSASAVRVSLGKRSDYERGAAPSRELGPGDAQFLGELGRWLKRKVVDTLNGPDVYGPLNALLAAADPNAAPIADRFLRVEALGQAIAQLSAEDQRRVISSSDRSARSLSEHFAAFMKRSLARSDGDRSQEILASTWTREPNVLFFGDHEPGGHTGGLSMWRDDAYVQGYYHRRLQEDSSPGLWDRVLDEQPMLAWDEPAGRYALKRGAEVQAHLLGALTEDADRAGLLLYRGMSNFEGALFGLLAALRDGPAPPDWRDTLNRGLSEVGERLAFEESWVRSSGATEKADAIAARRQTFAAESAKRSQEMKAIRTPEALRTFLRAQLLETVTQSSYGAYFMTPSADYANRFGGGQVAEFALSPEALASMSAEKQLYIGLEHSVEVGFLAGAGRLDPGALVDLLVGSYRSSKPTAPDY